LIMGLNVDVYWYKKHNNRQTFYETSFHERGN